MDEQQAGALLLVLIAVVLLLMLLLGGDNDRPTPLGDREQGAPRWVQNTELVTG